MNLTDPVFIKSDDQQTYHVTHACVSCGHVTKGDVPPPNVFQWRQGTAAQHAFPMLSATQVEALFMSGICGFCWDGLYGHDDEEDDGYTADEMTRMGQAYGELPADPDDGYYYSGTGEWSGDDSYIDYLNGR